MATGTERLKLYDSWPLAITSKGTELVIPIKIDVEVGGVRLVDSLVIDVLDEQTTPEMVRLQSTTPSVL